MYILFEKSKIERGIERIYGLRKIYGFRRIFR